MLATTKYGLSGIGSLVRFGLLALVPVVALGAVLAHELNADVQRRYLDTSRSSATLITQVGIQPLLNAQQVTDGFSPADIATMDEKLQGAALSEEVDRVKVWNRKGTVVYSDNHVIIGKSFPVDEDLGQALAGKANANLTDGRDAENAEDNLIGPLIQVYVPLVFKGSSSPSGAFELYLPYTPVQAAIDRESNQLYLLLAAGLTLFYASLFPVVLLAERWRRRLLHEAEATALANLAVLERLNKLKTEFLTRISHEFRTAMVGIEGFSEVIRDSEHIDPVEVRAYANDIHHDAERLDRALNEMLELDRMESGRTVLQIARMDINEVIREVLESIRRDSPQRVLLARLDDSAPAVPCDREKVAQVLANLVGNAIKFSRKGAEVVVTSESDAEQVTVTVKDHGPGMPHDFDDRLFTGRPANGSGGTGLGLPIARQIIEMHGGRIWFDSAAGQGTEFHFTLPLKVRPSRELKAVVRT